MFLKSLTLRGFKSFADKTELTFEPGITVVVGPNGSGKSNIVDALTWVLGTSSPKSLRGGSMADVIFAGSADKPALGRAAVEMTIDNSAGTLPIEFSEVAVGRSMFSSGETSYHINGQECRALDVQELLSDTGLGRQSHTIVGQGRLDAVLNARPEDRRAFVEEAAGILKHRRRKERALRKLAQMDAHVERMSDVLRELRRNLRPLERQAEAAAKHAELQAALRQVRVERAVRELARLTARSEGDASTRAESDARLQALERELAEVRRSEADIEQLLGRLTPQLQQATETHFGLAGLVERWRGLTERIAERRAGLVEAVEEPVAGRDPDELRQRAAEQRQRLAEQQAELQQARSRLDAASSARQAAEQARRAHDQAAAAEARRRAEARERRLRWEGELAAARSRLAQAAQEEGRLDSQLSGLAQRRAQLERDVASARAEHAEADAARTRHEQEVTAARAAADVAAEAVAAATATERELERDRASLEARAEALHAAARDPGTAAAELLEACERGELDGIVGPLSTQLRVAPEVAAGVAAALGALTDALVVDDAGVASRTLVRVRDDDAGRVVLLPGAAGPADAPASVPAPAGTRPIISAIDAPAEVRAALARALDRTFLVDTIESAAALAERHPDLVFVTPAGEMTGARGWASVGKDTATALLARAAAEQADSELADVIARLTAASSALKEADARREAARTSLEQALDRLRAADATAAAAQARLRRLEAELRATQRDQDEVGRRAADLAAEVHAQRQQLAALEARGEQLPSPDEPTGGADVEAERLDDQLAEAREVEVQARLTASAVEQRCAETERRARGLAREADDVAARLAERARRRERRLAAIARCEQLATLAAAALQQAERSLAQAAAERDRIDAARAAQQGELGAIRARGRALETELDALKEERHSSELRHQELLTAMAAVRRRLTEELDVDPDAALDDADPALLAGGEQRDTELAEREEELVRKVALLGTVNPLALEEFSALQERHTFLTGQLDDLRRSKRDLLEVIAAVDARIQEVFAAAFADVAAQFERIFPRLFPGGTGRLVLTDPDDLLTAGIEVEASPPGKRVKRLSLLSGGERSLTALAVLFAIFAARPSPFYVLDEVEAALDDVNLQRFLDVVQDFRGSSQMLIVSHQKRTMEIADCLYGVTMRRDGVSVVVSQRLNRDGEPEPAAAPSAMLQPANVG